MQHGRELLPGTMVAGEWHIDRMLGAGGFGVTYEARSRKTGAHVALKEYMPSGLCTRPAGSTALTPAQGPAGDIFQRGLAGFVKEAETLARLDHPSIVKVTEYFEANGTAYMALAYLQGGSVADWLKRLGRRPTQAELDQLLWPLIEALREVHALFVLHRDIKPDNIMLQADGTPVLIDFGAIKSLVSSETRSIGAGTLNLVTDGYAPPEQYVPDGESLLGPWTDVYALGATVYEAIAGRRPPSSPRRQIDDTHRPLTALSPDQIGTGWRPGFLAGIDRALSLKRSDRPQSAMELRGALGLTGSPGGTKALSEIAGELAAASPPPKTFSEMPSARPPTRAPRVAGPRSLARGLVLAGAVALLGFGSWYAAGHRAEEARRRDPALSARPGSGETFRDCPTCPEMVVVPAGRFRMGSPASEPGRGSDEQQVTVSIQRPFAIGKFAVTFDEWDACVADRGCDGHRPEDQGWGRGKRPVINVNWNDAKAYVAWLSRTTGRAYRLPSEAEREYVTRAGTTTPFWWGTAITPAQANYDGSSDPYKGGGSKGEYRRRTLPVDSFQPNPWGLYQVHGNVWEWTEDCWIDRNTGNPGNGDARTTGCTTDDRRVVRGGSWYNYPQYLRSADRDRNTTDNRINSLGFRLARTLPP